MAAGGNASSSYRAGDLIDSTMAATDATGFAIAYTGGGGAGAMTLVTYSAFGEVPDAAGTPGGSAPAGFPRYQYAGGFGYESDVLALSGANLNLAPVTLQHLGWRWYDPAIGRFVQRDPIGISGAVDVYLLSTMCPVTSATDPLGLQSSLESPEGLCAIIETALVESGEVIIYHNVKQIVIKVRYGSNDKVEAFILEGGGEFPASRLPAHLDVTCTSDGIVLHNPPKSACGATGLEILPFVIWAALRKCHHRRAPYRSLRKETRK